MDTLRHVEIWKEVSLDKRYHVSNFGNIKGPVKPELKKRIHTNGYLRVCIKSKDYYIHRLVAQEFIGPLYGKEVNHKNSIKTDNSVENLEIVTRQENVVHCYKSGSGKDGQKKRVNKLRGSGTSRSFLTEGIVMSLREQHQSGVGVTELSRNYQINKSTLEKILYYHTWTHVK